MQTAPETSIDVGWLIGTARHKLIDHWRRNGRQRDALAELWEDLSTGTTPGHDHEPIDVEHAQATLALLAPHAPRRADPALPRRAAGRRGGRRHRPHRARHRITAHAGQDLVPPHVRFPPPGDLMTDDQQPPRPVRRPARRRPTTAAAPGVRHRPPQPTDRRTGRHHVHRNIHSNQQRHCVQRPLRPTALRPTPLPPTPLRPTRPAAPLQPPG